MRLLAIAVLVALPSGVFADEPTDQQRANATRLLEKGNKLYESGEYDLALDAYRGAYEHTGAPGFLYNIAQTYRLKGNCLDAQTSYEQFLEAAPETARKPQVEGLIAEMEQCVAERRARLLRRPEAAGAVRDEPGTGGAASRDLPPSGSGLRLFGVLTAVGGIALTSVGTVFALDARKSADELSSHTGEWTGTEVNKEADGQRSSSVAMVMITAGGVAIVGGVVMYVLGGRQDVEPSGAVTLDISGSGAVIGYGGRF